jgi:hypothetical protein
VSKTQRYLDDAEAAFEDLCAVIESSDPALWNEPEREGEWSMRQLAAHVSANTRFHAELARAFINGGPPEAAPTGWAAERDAALATGPAATVAWMRADHASQLPFLRSLTDEELSKSGQTKLGELTVEYLLRRLSAHARQHTRQARRIRQVVESRTGGTAALVAGGEHEGETMGAAPRGRKASRAVPQQGTHKEATGG